MLLMDCVKTQLDVNYSSKWDPYIEAYPCSPFHSRFSVQAAAPARVAADPDRGHGAAHLLRHRRRLHPHRDRDALVLRQRKGVERMFFVIIVEFCGLRIILTSSGQVTPFVRALPAPLWLWANECLVPVRVHACV